MQVFVTLFSLAVGAPLDIDADKDGAHISVNDANVLSNNQSLAINTFNVIGGSSSGCCGGDKDGHKGKETTKVARMSTRNVDPWVIVIGGDNSSGTLLREVEVISLDEKHHPVPQCLRKLIDFPTTIEDGLGGAVLDASHPLVCGGRHSESQHQDYLSDCYTYEHRTQAWVGAGSLPFESGNMASSIHPELGIFITGGDATNKVGTSFRRNSVLSTKDGLHYNSKFAKVRGCSQNR